ncbi:ABC transporter substrate-binding protein [Variovorax sp. JS1663]|uniref:ABC transporter substrate-binding protein n=1 Tax=Variovorax sp. JS1663 TaxID=1851577 RepID=UPI000B34643E|nr:ABC transporter substrate-binding protein [Variovorax sp. JS1663]OUM02417.1 amino acid ABC transporter substrate-binding protein [Variovorax sp. JS1663]OUM02498.1 amino acid ABC transporter substrate-binding protein [Variovorax sp. JS1663]
MRFRFAAAAFAAAALLAGTAVHADQLDDIKKKGQLVVGVLGTDEPATFIDPKTREIIGYEVDLVNAIAKKIGVKPVLKQIAVAARIPELQQGHVDLVAAGLTHNKEREAQIDFSLTTFVTGQKAIVKKTSNITEVSQLGGKKVLTIRGGTQEPNIRKAVPSAEVVTFDTSQQAFQALQQGKGVGYVDDEAALLNSYAKLGPQKTQYVVLPQNLSTEALAIGIKKGETGLKKVVDDTLRELEKSGEAEKIFFKWYGPKTKSGFDKRGFKLETDKIDS